LGRLRITFIVDDRRICLLLLVPGQKRAWLIRYNQNL